MHLPPHYINMFAPTPPSRSLTELERDSGSSLEVGQTAFIVRSHRVTVCAELMRDQTDRPDGLPHPLEVTEAAQAMRSRLLVRPHLDAGDVILFDCRVLHFGLANRGRAPSPGHAGGTDSAAQRRPVLYVNYTQPWFEDKKNWELEHLFK